MPDSINSADQQFEYASWFISLRWMAIVTAAILSTVAVHVVHLLPQESWIPMVIIILVLSVLNFGYRRVLKSNFPSDRMTIIQAYSDLILLTALIHFSGGIENPLVLLMIFHVIIAGITLSKRQCFFVATFATLLVALLAWTEARGLIQHYTLQIVPHYEDHGETAHAAYDTLFVTSYVGLQGSILLLTAFFVTNLTEKLRSKEKLLAISAERALTHHQLLDQALESTNTGLYVCNQDLEKVVSNSRWNSWFEDSSDGELYSEGLFGANSSLRKTLDTGLNSVNEFSIESDRSEDEREPLLQTFQTRTAPLLDKAGRTTLIVQLVRDISIQKRAQAQLIRAGQLAAVGELAGQVAHEVNNPIAIISTKARLLLSDHSSEMSDKTAEEINKMIHLADRVARIAAGLLSFSRPSGAARIMLNLRNPVNKALALVAQRANSAGIEIFDLLPKDLPVVFANEQEIEQVFLNLYLNSFDAMKKGGTLKLEAEVSASQDSVRIIVTDSGEGMSEEVRSRIFEPFFTTKPEGKGTGLGLSICHGIMTTNGGTISVASIQGEGTRITIGLPIHEKVSG